MKLIMILTTVCLVGCGSNHEVQNESAAAAVPIVTPKAPATPQIMAAPTPANCIVSWDGTLRDQTGQPCNSASLCSGYTYSGGQYINPANPTDIASCDGTNGPMPSTGYYNGTYATGIAGCQQATQENVQIYGSTWGTYVPVNIGGGQVICASWGYLHNYASSAPNTAYQNPTYWYQNPPTLYQCDPVYGCSGQQGYSAGYYGYGQGCASNVSLGFSATDFPIGLNLCF